MEEKLTRLNGLEQIFSINKYKGTGNKDYIYRKGKVPILVSAPHAVKQTSEHKIKLPDMCTGGIALLLNELTDCHVIAKSRDNGVDPNRSEMDDEYKKEIVNIIKNNDIKLLIDLHGLSDHRKADVDIITHYGKTIGQNSKIIDELKKCFEESGILNLSEDKYYFAKSEKVIVHYIWNLLELPAIELEVNWHFRNLDEPNNLIKLINALEGFGQLKK